MVLLVRELTATIYIYMLADPSRGRPEGSLFNSYNTEM